MPVILSYSLRLYGNVGGAYDRAGAVAELNQGATVRAANRHICDSGNQDLERRRRTGTNGKCPTNSATAAHVTKAAVVALCFGPLCVSTQPDATVHAWLQCQPASIGERYGYFPTSLRR